MSEVQAELSKLRRMKRTNMKHLEEDWDDLKCALSPENLLHEAVGRLSCRLPWLGTAIAGVQAAASLIRNRRNHNSCGCE
jgi:hypothetical protein